MSAFTEQEIAYLRERRLGRLATVGADGMPHLTAIGFYAYNRELDTLDIGGGRGYTAVSKKFRDAKATGKAAFIVDDVRTERGWQPRGIEIRGRAETHETGGEAIRPGGDPAFIRLHPTRIVSWGINAEGYRPDSRDVG